MRALLVPLLLGASQLGALSPHKTLTQYARTVWTQAQGLPQDTVRAIAQTKDGYLWLGTEEGLARFDGYEFLTFSTEDGSLPSSSIMALCAGRDGGLWIGTPGGLTHYAGGRFQSYAKKDGLPNRGVGAVFEDHTGALWFTSGGVLGRFADGKFTTYSKEQLAPVDTVQIVYEDPHQQLWVGGFGGIVRLAGAKFVPVLSPAQLRSNIITAILGDDQGLWFAGNQGIILMKPDGSLRYFTTQDGLPFNLVRALWRDRSGTLWVGTNGGLSRLENDRFRTPILDNSGGEDWVRSIFEDREGDLWVGMNSALNRFREDRVSMYGRSEGLPSDQPIAVHQDRRGRLWVGYHDRGLLAFSPGKNRLYGTASGMLSNEVFGIREARNGDLLVSTRVGLSRMHDGRFSNDSVPDPLGRTVVYDALEDSHGHLWAANASGVYEKESGVWRAVVRSDSAANAYTISLLESRDGSIWAGTLNNGLWQIPGPSHTGKPRLYARGEGIPNGQMRSLYEDSDGALWLGTVGGGLAVLRNGTFYRYSARDGLLSDNISHIEDDLEGNLWLSTTRGICRISKQQLRDFSEGKIHALTPQNYGIADGLRSAQCAPGYPAGGGGTRASNGDIWFPTARGLAMLNPKTAIEEAPQASPAPITRVVEISVDGQAVDPPGAATLKPGVGRIQFRYTGIYLSAPERVRYFTKLEGLDQDWVPAGNRRLISYTFLPHGKYRFLVRSGLPEGGETESAFAFEVLPHLYERASFFWICGLCLLAAVYGMHQFRIKQMSGRFALVLEERSRIAREIHDTLAQDFVGICSQLDALAMKIGGDPSIVRQHLDLARKMARHVLTEARRSVMDLRTPELEGQDFAGALAAAAHRWTAGSSASIQVKVDPVKQKLPSDLEQHLLRIAQEAVANALKHAKAHMIWVELESKDRMLELRIKDDGQGFEPSSAMSILAGHYGILGMRERAERVGGEFDLESGPGSGTRVEVRVPIANGNSNGA